MLSSHIELLGNIGRPYLPCSIVKLPKYVQMCVFISPDYKYGSDRDI